MLLFNFLFFFGSVPSILKHATTLIGASKNIKLVHLAKRTATEIKTLLNANDDDEEGADDQHKTESTVVPEDDEDEEDEEEEEEDQDDKDDKDEETAAPPHKKKKARITDAKIHF